VSPVAGRRLERKRIGRNALKIAVVVRPPSDEERIVKLQHVVRDLREAGHTVRVRMTFEGGDAQRFARHAARARIELLLVAGGDGTINEVVNGIAREAWQPRLGIVPFGTANDFATALRLPEDPREAVRLAMHGHPMPVDLAQVNRRFFVNVSTGGFGAQATEEASRQVKRKLGPLAYVISGAKRLIRFAPRRACFRADGEVVHDGEFVFFAVGNSRLTGGGTRITPRAEFGDGKLDIVLVGGVSRIDFLSLLPDLRAGTHMESPGVLYLRAHRFEIESDRDVPVNADGEPLRARRFRYRLLDRPLTIMVPHDGGAERGRNIARS
jgi:diacylglycerol kinase (ATP)